MKMAWSQRSLHSFALHCIEVTNLSEPNVSQESLQNGGETQDGPERDVWACEYWGDLNPVTSSQHKALEKGNEQPFHWSSQDESDLTCMIRFSFITWG